MSEENSDQAVATAAAHLVNGQPTENQPLLGHDSNGNTHNFFLSRYKLRRRTRYNIIILVVLFLLLFLLVTYYTNSHSNSNSNSGSDGSSDRDKKPKYTLPPSNITRDGLLKVSLASVRNKTFEPKLHHLQWLESNTSASEDKGLYVSWVNDTYLIQSVMDPEFSHTLLEGKNFTQDGHTFEIDEIVASPNLETLLIRTNTVKNWRHSKFGTYFVYSEPLGTFEFVGDNLALAVWSPDSNHIAYVQDNDIYVYSVNEHRTVRQITNDGSQNIFNGRPDWVYEEEVFASDKALWWSPGGTHLAYVKIDETEVRDYIIPYYVQHTDDVYPEMRSIKYPKSGTPNPSVDLYIYSMDKSDSYHVNPSRHFMLSDILLTEVVWIGDGRLIAKLTNRSSDVLKILEVDADGRSSAIIRVNDAAEENGWWEITSKTMYIPRDPDLGLLYDGYIDLVPVDGYDHLVYFSPANSSQAIILTIGDWEVVQGPLAFDRQLKRVYFIATRESPGERHLYYVSLDRPLEVVPVTNTSEEGVYSVSFSSSSRFALLTYKGPKVPYQKIIDLRSDKIDENPQGNVLGETLYYLEKNEELETTLALYDIPGKSFKEISYYDDVDGKNVSLAAYEILPNDFNSSLADYYPVFFFTYGGPGSQKVIKEFSIGFNEVIAAQLDAIVVVVDGRGTGYKGRDFRCTVRGRLGDLEARDQIAAASMYAKRSYVDAEKISLFGWSYGGYLTLKTLERDAGENFKYGMAVAPVTNWKFYDSVYTERYMYTPQENEAGYQESSVHDVLSLGKVKRFLLAHGTGDDNVHLQHTLVLLDELNLNGVENYDIAIYPDSDHGIKFHNADVIVYDKLFSWTKRAFSGDFVKQSC